MKRGGGGAFQLHLLLLLVAFNCASSAYTPTDVYRINCGASTETTFFNTVFESDSDPSDSWSLSSATESFAAETTANDGSTLYRTARVFPEVSHYKFPIKKQGMHFVRLYFMAFRYKSYNLSDARFSVTTGLLDVTLLSDFSAGKEEEEEFKEYLVNVNSDELVISFSPTSQDSFAFVNAIEIMSVPDNLIGDTAVITDGVEESYTGLKKTAFESVFRVNMGGSKILPSNDTLGRTWSTDEKFIVNENFGKPTNFSGKLNHYPGGATEETAPDHVYRTCVSMVDADVVDARFNVSWVFPLDSRYIYFVRFHFCNIVSKAQNELRFNVYVNDSFVAKDFDAGEKTTHLLAAPFFLDAVVKVKDPSGKVRVGIGPPSVVSAGRAPTNAILNGVEILRMNSSTGSLDGERVVVDVRNDGSKRILTVVIVSVSVAVAFVLLVAILVYMVLRKKNKKVVESQTPSPQVKLISTGERSSYGSNHPSGMSFTFAVLQEATNDFAESEVVGEGGYGKVYRGVLKNQTKIAVKRANPNAQQGLKEFRTEIQLLSQLRHRHLVSLIGYCDEGREMILVYEYMDKGTVKSFLYGKGNANPSWKQRLEICVGAARGLYYLHTGQTKAIIHRDVKTANILLDEKLTAKVADFGLSKTGPDIDQTHVSTAVKGSFGYLDPEYFRRQQLTDKSDVYSFGVVLFEVLSARPVIDSSLPKDQVNLPEWALKCHGQGKVEEVVDSRIVGTVTAASLRKFVETAVKCLEEYGCDRPSMGDVLWNLEYALQLQEPECENSGEEGGSSIERLSLSVIAQPPTSTVAGMGGSPEQVDGRRQNVSDSNIIRGVFSQAFTNEGR